MNLLIIGYGSIGKRHTGILKEFRMVNNIDIVTHQDLKDHKTFKDISDIKDISLYDYFIISSETSKHYEQLNYINSHVIGKKILVEKPLFDVYKKLKPHNSIYVGYNLRFHPVLQRIKHEIKDKKVLSVNVIAGQYLPDWRPDIDYHKSYSADKLKGGGVLLDLSHEVDYIQWLFGRIIKVSSINCRISDLEIDSDDIVTAIGITDRKIVINFTMDYISKIKMRKMIIHLNEKTIIGDLIDNKITVSSINSSCNEETVPDVKRNDTYENMHRAIMSDRAENLCDIQKGLEVMKTIKKIKRATLG